MYPKMLKATNRVICVFMSAIDFVFIYIHVCVFAESQSEISTLETELKKISDQKQDLERKLRVGEDDKASFEKVSAAVGNCFTSTEASRACVVELCTFTTKDLL